MRRIGGKDEAVNREGAAILAMKDVKGRLSVRSRSAMHDVRASSVGEGYKLGSPWLIDLFAPFKQQLRDDA